MAKVKGCLPLVGGERGVYVTFAISLLLGAILALNAVALSSSSLSVEKVGKLALVDRVFDRYSNLRDTVTFIVQKALNQNIIVTDDAVYFNEILPADDVSYGDFNQDLNHFSQFAQLFRDDLNITVDIAKISSAAINIQPCDINHYLYSTGSNTNNASAYDVGDENCAYFLGYDLNFMPLPANYKDTNWKEQHLDNTSAGRRFKLFISNLGIPPADFTVDVNLNMRDFRNLFVVHHSGNNAFDLNIQIGPGNDLNIIYQFVVDINTLTGPKFVPGSDISVNAPKSAIQVLHVDSNAFKGS